MEDLKRKRNMARNKILADTGIISRYVTGDKYIVSELMKYNNSICISLITHIELNNWLFEYSLSREEKAKLKSIISSFEIIHIDNSISNFAMKISSLNQKSKPSDLLIYSTAKVKKLQLFTLNSKDFKLKHK